MTGPVQHAPELVMPQVSDVALRILKLHEDYLASLRVLTDALMLPPKWSYDPNTVFEVKP